MDHIRLATLDDLERAAAILESAIRWLDEQGIPQWDAIYPNRSDLETDIAHRHLHVIETDGRIVGLVTLNEDQPPEYGDVAWNYSGTVLVVHRLVVDPEYQGQKLASRLLAFAEHTAAALGYRVIRLDAFTRNPAAIALYERRGYRRAGTVLLRKGLFFCYEKPMLLPGDQQKS